eukprot:415481-Amphidinium_carterae.1
MLSGIYATFGPHALIPFTASTAVSMDIPTKAAFDEASFVSSERGLAQVMFAKVQAVLQEDSRWQGIDTIHQCEEDPIRRAAIIGALEEFPMTHFEMWVLLHPDLPIRSDVLVLNLAFTETLLT